MKAPALVSELAVTSIETAFGKASILNPNEFSQFLSKLKLNTPMSFVLPGVGSCCPSFNGVFPSFTNINRQGKP